VPALSKYRVDVRHFISVGGRARFDSLPLARLPPNIRLGSVFSAIMSHICWVIAYAERRVGLGRLPRVAESRLGHHLSESFVTYNIGRYLLAAVSGLSTYYSRLLSRLSPRVNPRRASGNFGK